MFRFATILGLTDEDVKLGLQTIVKPEDKKNYFSTIKLRYNGFRFNKTSQETLYCTNMVLEAFEVCSTQAQCFYF